MTAPKDEVLVVSPSARIEMRISIVIPSFNQAQYLDTAIRSVVDQDYADKEVIVMDGGSTDESIEVIRKYEGQLAFWRSGPDGGQANAISTGFDHATGQLFGWINSDDALAPGALNRLVKQVRRAGGPNAVFHGGWEVIDSYGRVQEVFFGIRTLPWLARTIGPIICQPGTFFGREEYFRVGGIDQQLRYALDFDLWMRFVVARVPFFTIPAIQAQFRSHTMQKGHNVQWLKHCADEERLMRERYNMAPQGSWQDLLARQVQRMIRLTSFRQYQTVALRVARHGRWRCFAVDYSH